MLRAPNLDQGADRIREQVRSAPVAWLATVNSDGSPHVVPIWFSVQQGTVVTLAKPGSRKVRNVHRQPAVALAIEERNESGMRSTLLTGHAELLPPEEVVDVGRFATKYHHELAAMGRTVESFTAVYSQPMRITIDRCRSYGAPPEEVRTAALGTEGPDSVHFSRPDPKMSDRTMRLATAQNRRARSFAG